MNKILWIFLSLAAFITIEARAQTSQIYLFEKYAEDPEINADNPDFDPWFAARVKTLNKGSEVAQTAMGPIEYRKKGSGPAVIVLHGAYGGYDESFLIADFLVSKGFTVIGVSRPGYLRTPLSVGQTPEQQADAMIALMDTLGLQKAAAMGFSAGSLTAFQMAARHPDRIWACMLTGVGALPDDFQPGGTYDQFRAIVGDDDIVPALDRVSMFIYDLAKTSILLTCYVILPDDVLTDMPALDLAKRILYVTQRNQQRVFLRDFMYTLTPYSLRREGLYNDIKDDISIDPWAKWIEDGVLQAVTVPTQIVQAVWDGSGNYDEAVNVIAPNIPTATLVSVEGTGHFVWLGENTNAWEKQTLNFLKANRP